MTAKRVTTSEPTLIFKFEDRWRSEPNALYEQGGKLILVREHDGETESHGEVELVDALKWYCRCESFSLGSTEGSLLPLLEAATVALQRRK